MSLPSTWVEGRIGEKVRGLLVSHNGPQFIRTLHRLPPTVSYATAALIEPLSVAIHATRRTLRNGSLSPGSTVLVIGAGAVGLLVGAMAKLSGASRVIITDINQGRVDFAIKEGFGTQGFELPCQGFVFC